MVSQQSHGDGECANTPNSKKLAPGPYRATKLWNALVQKFREEMQCKRHRRHFKAYNQCFSAAEATDFLHEVLKRNPNLGEDVTRRQTVQLLGKFLQNHIIEDVQGRWGSENFECDGKLYRFPPIENTEDSVRRPLATIDENVSINQTINNNHKKGSAKRKRSQAYPFPDFQTDSQENESSTTECEHLKRPLPPVSAIPKCRVISPKITEDDINDTWKKVILERMREGLQLESLCGVVVEDKIQGNFVRHNATRVGRSGVVQVEKEEDIPYWALSAMTCLANWPNSTDTGLPCYPGFERDIFKAVCDYFKGLEPVSILQYGTAKKRTGNCKPVSIIQSQEPLLTYDCYELFTNAICLIQGETQQEAIKALRYALLILPPVNRRKLHLLTRLLAKMCKNSHLEKIGGRVDVRSLVLDTFSKVVMSYNEEVYLDELLSMRLLSFLIDHHSTIFKVPEDVENLVEAKLAQMRRPEVRYDDAPQEIPHMRRVLASAHGAKVRLRQKSRMNRGDRAKRKSADLMKSWDKLVTTFKSRPVSHAPLSNCDERDERPEHDTYLRMRLRSRRAREDPDAQQSQPRPRTRTVGDRDDIPDNKLAASTRHLAANFDPSHSDTDDGNRIKPAKSCSDICDIHKPSGGNLAGKATETGSVWNLKMFGRPFSRLRKSKV